MGKALLVSNQKIALAFTATGKTIQAKSHFLKILILLVSSVSFDTVLEMSVDGAPAFTQEIAGEDYLVTGTWKLEGDKLTITNEALEQTDIADVLLTTI